MSKHHPRRISALGTLLILVVSALPIGLLLSPAAGATSASVTAPTGILYYVPVTLTNAQTSATPAPFQELLQVDSSAYSSYEAANLQNIEFFDSNGNVIPSWLESGNSNTATTTSYWISLQNGIAADSSVTVYMGFASLSTNLFSSLVGEAPDLSASYGEYDNGPQVFSLYWNFAGSSLPSGWSFSIANPGSPDNGGYSVSDGASFYTGSCGQQITACQNTLYGYYDSPLNAGSYVISTEMQSYAAGNNGEGVWFGWWSDPQSPSPTGGNGNYVSDFIWCPFFNCDSNSGGYQSTFDVVSNACPESGPSSQPAGCSQSSSVYDAYLFMDYSVSWYGSTQSGTLVPPTSGPVTVSQTQSSPAQGSYYLGFWCVTAGAGNNGETARWVAVSAMPPDGVMPTSSLGSLIVANSQGVACNGSSIMISGITPNQGPNNLGTSISISGCGFVPGPNSPDEVVFGSSVGTFACNGTTSPSCTVESSTLIQITTPVTTVTGPVQVSILDSSDSVLSSESCSFYSPPCNGYYFEPPALLCENLNNPVPSFGPLSYTLDQFSVGGSGSLTGSGEICLSSSNIWDPSTYEVYASGTLYLETKFTLALTTGVSFGESTPTCFEIAPPAPACYAIQAGPVTIMPAFEYGVSISATITVNVFYDVQINLNSLSITLPHTPPGSLIPYSISMVAPTITCYPQGLPSGVTETQNPSTCITIQPVLGQTGVSGSLSANLGISVGIGVAAIDTGIYVFPNAYLLYNVGCSLESCTDSLQGGISVIAGATALGINLGTLTWNPPGQPIPILPCLFFCPEGSGTVSSGSGSVNLLASNGVTLSFTGSTAPDGTPFTVVADPLTGPPATVTSPPLDVAFYNVSISGVTNGMGTVCVESPPDAMYYWNGVSWVAAARVTDSDGQVCGNVPIASLGVGTVAVGSQITVALSVNSVLPGKAVVVTVTVTDSTSSPVTPTGKVSLSDLGAGGKFKTATCTLKAVSTGIGRCSDTYTTHAPGQVTINAIYAGDSHHQSSSRSTQLTVLRKTSKVSLVLSATKDVVGVPVTITATVTDLGPGAKNKPTGVVEWGDGGLGGTFSSPSCTLAGSAPTTSTCSVTYIPQQPGTITLTANYQGDAEHNPSAQKSALTATARPTTTKLVASATTIAPGAMVTLNVTVTDTTSGSSMVPLGSVTWKSSGSGGAFSAVSCVLAPTGPKASQCTVTFTAPTTSGTITITGTYDNDIAHSSSAAELTLNIT